METTLLAWECWECCLGLSEPSELSMTLPFPLSNLWSEARDGALILSEGAGWMLLVICGREACREWSCLSFAEEARLRRRVKEGVFLSMRRAFGVAEAWWPADYKHRTEQPTSVHNCICLLAQTGQWALLLNLKLINHSPPA